MMSASFYKISAQIKNDSLKSLFCLFVKKLKISLHIRLYYYEKKKGWDKGKSEENTGGGRG